MSGNIEKTSALWSQFWWSEQYLGKDFLSVLLFIVFDTCFQSLLEMRYLAGHILCGIVLASLM